ncbi:MAG: type transport system permease protein [Actinomycetota bacterium]|jgi:ABC-2 type transport system permease protein|nr:type transport system permease protein [Actinomycetota bacterium]
MTAFVNATRIFFLGGIMSYRALFNWLSPWILIPSFLVGPIAQILLFAFLGRSAGVASDEFFVVGNALQYAAIPCLFAMGNTIGDERQEKTLGIILSTPAPRVPLFLGRAIPVIANGFLVALFSLVVGGAIFSIDVPGSAYFPIAVVTLVASFSCTGLGLVCAALSLRVRETAVLANVIFGVLLVFCGVNVPLDSLPEWMQSVSPWLPLTHGIAAARRLADGATFSSVTGDLFREAGVGALYVLIGMAMLSYFEWESRRRATLEVF